MQQNWDSGCTTKKVCSKEPPSESFTESNELETRPGDILKYSCSGQEYAIYMIRKTRSFWYVDRLLQHFVGRMRWWRQARREDDNKSSS